MQQAGRPVFQHGDAPQAPQRSSLAFQRLQPVWSGTIYTSDILPCAVCCQFGYTQCPSTVLTCPQVGHQAAQCTNGTINWKGIYGEDAFKLRDPLYHSDYSRIAQEKKVDLTALEARARQYAKVSYRQCPGQCQRHVLHQSWLPHGLIILFFCRKNV